MVCPTNEPHVGTRREYQPYHLTLAESQDGTWGGRASICRRPRGVSQRPKSDVISDLTLPLMTDTIVVMEPCLWS